MKSETYYLGLDIGTDSVGYAVTDPDYQLLKAKGEPMWGTHVFEAASQCAERRGFRTARRRLDRRQQRVKLLEELFAKEIVKVDPRFFIRRKESALFQEDKTDSSDRFVVFNDTDYSDKAYYKDYPTIHHLITSLIRSDKAFDVRMVFQACAWLVAHRGHFLSEVDKDNIDNVRDFHPVYTRLMDYFDDLSIERPWDCGETSFSEIMKQKKGVSVKEKRFYELLYDGKKPKAEDDATYPSRAGIIKLLCGGKCKAKDVFKKEEYEEIPSFSLGDDDDALAVVFSQLGDDAELIIRLKALYDWAVLIDALAGKEFVSEAKVQLYEQHKTDLKNLKAFIRKYRPEKYYEIFRAAKPNNYVAYSQNVKSVKKKNLPDKLDKAKKEDFSKYILSIIKGIECDEKDSAVYQDMIARLETASFLPRQVEGDNRVIPYQLYYYELKRILENAKLYLPFLSIRDEDGLTVVEKILSIMTFRVPYYVGPTNPKSSYAWIVRKAEGKLYPWNFSDKVDLDASEQAFINRMTNSCTYLAGESVLPKNSLLYCKFTVLNEINNLKINGQSLTAEQKQNIFIDLFLHKTRVTVKAISDYCQSNGFMRPGDELTGIDITVKSSMKPFLDFKRLLTSKTLTEDDVETIIERITYTEDKPRLARWLKASYSQLSEEDIRYISRLKYSDFGRLSRRFLEGIVGCKKETGEIGSIIGFLWETNQNLMQLLSDDFTFLEVLQEQNASYYAQKPLDIVARLDEMYISNAVKRPIIRTLDIVKEIVKVTGSVPKKIFVEMARGASEDQRGVRTKTRKQQLLELYSKVNTEDVRLLEKQLEEMGDTADNRLQSEALFLYYLQLGKCAYTGQAIDIAKLKSNEYNIDHIWPQSFIKDDSILNNKVLVLSTANGKKGNDYPVPAEYRTKMSSLWKYLKNNGLMTKEKYQRLTRSFGFSEHEKMDFINRQLVETRQSTKAVAEILKELYPDTEIVYVKAGLVSDFRHEFDMLKCREVNDLHHAKDAYLNIVVGNVYHEKFSKRWFSPNDEYSLKTKVLFGRAIWAGGIKIWSGGESLKKVSDTMRKNNLHLTRYAFCKKGKLYDVMPLSAKEGLIPRKKGLDPIKYGGYNKTTASFFMLTKYSVGKKTDAMIVPIDLMYADKVKENRSFAENYVAEQIQKIISKKVDTIELPLGLRPLKINTVFEVDGNMRLCLSGKNNGGRNILMTSLSSLKLTYKDELYCKKLVSFCDKKKKNSSLIISEEYDKITKEDNLALFDTLVKKHTLFPFKSIPGNQLEILNAGRDSFIALSVEEQANCLLQIINLLKTCRSGGCDLILIGGVVAAGAIRPSSNLSNWKKRYNSVRIVDTSATGIFEKKSENLLNLL